MVSEDLLEECLQVLESEKPGEEELAERAEEYLREKTSLSGTSLENAVLDVLWRRRNRVLPGSTAVPLRHTVIRRSSPAPWQMAGASTPISPHSNFGTSPGNGSFIPNSRGGLSRAPLPSSAASPFSSPRPSPRLAFAQPIPHSPSLNTYEFSDQSDTSNFYTDLGSDRNVDWLVSDDADSFASSSGAQSIPNSLSATAPEFVPDMGPHDILRTVLGDQRTNEEIEDALEENGYDIGATVASLSQDQDTATLQQPGNDHVLVGKSIVMDQSRAETPPSAQRSPVVCKYWLSTGQCLRADCRFSHDLTHHVCK